MIYANHLVQAAIASMQTISTNILNAGTTGYIEPEIATVKDIFNLVNTKALEELEKDVQAFMSEKTVM